MMINGAPTDNNAKLFKKGAHSVFDAEGVKIGKEYDTPDWSPDKAQQEMEQAITALGKDGFDGVYAANDGTAGGAIAAMKSAGINPADRPDDRPGRRAGRHPADPRRRAVHDRLQGDQARGRGRRRDRGRPGPGRGAAASAWSTEHGRQRPEGRAVGRCSTPVAVTKDNINDTVVKDGFWKASADLHRQVRERLQGGRHRVGEPPRGRASPPPGPRPHLDMRGSA